MAGRTLTATSALQCPHQGKVTAVPGNSRTLASGAPVLCATDVFTVAGCTASPPCVTVRWEVSDTEVTVLGAETLSEGSVGYCLSASGTPQGAVVVLSTQSPLSTV